LGEFPETIYETDKERKKKNMITIKSFNLSCVSAIGGALVVLGEIDDSPGLGGIGFILIGISFYLIQKIIKNNK